MPSQVFVIVLRLRLTGHLHVHSDFDKRRHLPSFVPFVYTQTEISPLKTSLSKNSGQSGDFGKLRLRVCM